MVCKNIAMDVQGGDKQPAQRAEHRLRIGYKGLST